MNLRSRLLVGLSLIATLILVTAALGTINIRMIAKADVKLYRARTLPLNRLAEMATAFDAMRRTSRELVLAGNPAEVEKCSIAIKDLNDQVAKGTDLCMNCHGADQDKSKMFQDFKDASNAYNAYAGRIIEAKRAKKDKEAIALLNQDEQKTAEAVQDWIKTFREAKTEAAQGTAEENSALASRSTTIMAVAVLAALALIAGTGFLFTRSITCPVSMVEGALGALAEGDFTQRIEVNCQDEIGRMSNALNRALEKMNAAMQLIGRNSEFLGSSFEELSAVSHRMRSNAEGTAAQSGIVSAAAERVNASLQSVASATEEMTSSIKEIAQNANQAAMVANSAVKTAENANATVAKLGHASNEIGQVIKVIASIAQQTNLLALNATIEAARAGEAGKGFSVVANEVKELAKGTAKATEDIMRTVGSIQADTKDVVEAIAEFSGVITKISDISNTIASAVEEQTVATNEISRSIAEAAKGGGQVAENISAVADAAKNSSGEAAQVQAAAGELGRVSAELQNLTKQFKCLSDGATSSATEQIKKAIATHGLWKVKLKDFLQGKGNLDPATVQKSNACEFGQWLEREGTDALGRDAAEISSMHAQFHRAAADIVRKKKSGDVRAAQDGLEWDSEFTRISTGLVIKLRQLQRSEVSALAA